MAVDVRTVPRSRTNPQYDEDAVAAARGEAVFHLMGDDRVEPARLSDGARVDGDGCVTYPAG